MKKLIEEFIKSIDKSEIDIRRDFYDDAHWNLLLSLKDTKQEVACFRFKKEFDIDSYSIFVSQILQRRFKTCNHYLSGYMILENDSLSFRYNLPYILDYQDNMAIYVLIASESEIEI